MTTPTPEAIEAAVFAYREITGDRSHPTIHDSMAAALSAAYPFMHSEPTLTYSGNVRGGRGGFVPDGWDIKDWHRDAMADTNTSHSLHGRLYVIQCQWCPEAFAAPTKAEAMVLFRAHENDMQIEGKES